MRIFIITMDDPVQTKDFIKKIIDARSNDIVGLAVPKGDRLTLSKDKSKYTYIFSLLLIMGVFQFSKNAFISIWHKLRKLMHKFGLSADPTILGYAHQKGIPVFSIKTPNSKAFREQVASLKPDIIINQSQNIIKRELLDIPSIGILNRHNALLPKNRGRLTPFWVVYKKEQETGVSIHFVNEGIDAGAIIVQEKYAVSRKDTFNTLVKKNYQIAPVAMLKAINLLESGYDNFITNDDSMATYNTTPSFMEALKYRIQIVLRW
jgi:methionyl-tRNA formyltransferase